MPVAIPEVELIGAIPLFMLAQVPPDMVLNSVVEFPLQNASEPVMAGGVAYIVTTFVTLQPNGDVYVIIEVPAVMPVTTPPVTTQPPGNTDHIPPAPEPSVVEVPSHTVAAPVMAAGKGFTVTVATSYSEPTVYVMVVVPAAMPVTTPVAAFTVPTATTALLQVPPVVVLARDVVEPTQTLNVPVIGATTANDLDAVNRTNKSR
jgi:hypothetical protein